MPEDLKLALDFSLPNRHTDADGRLHIRVSNISKACVNPYMGSEIPGYEDMGLDPGKAYQLYRDPDELKKGAETFNNIPLLRRHVAVSADDPHKDDVVGSLGTDAAFVDPYLQNSIVVWDAEAIAGIESGAQREISCSYRYRADMTPIEILGIACDGIMRDIIGNHSALVEAGRAGSDVIVGDSKLEVSPMSKPLTSRKALMVAGALAVHVKPMLATGKVLAFDSILGGVTRSNYGEKKSAILAAIKPLLASDADPEKVKAALDSMDDETDGADDEDKVEKAADAEKKDPDDDDENANDEECMAARAADGFDKMSAKDKKAWDAKWAKDKPARDEKKAEDARAKDAANSGIPNAKAMDAAISSAVSAVEKTTIARMNAIREAEKLVRPFVGELAVAMDSAEAVHKFALDQLEIDVTGVHPSAYAAILKMQPKAGAQPKPRLAMDSAAANDLFPDARRIGFA